MKRTLLALILIIVLSASLASCARHKSLASYIENNSDIAQEFKSLGDSSGFSMEVDGNTLICIYDIRNLEGMTEELAKSDSTERTLSQSLNDRKDVYASLCSDLEQETGISGISIIVRYNYGGHVITERTFTSEG